MAEPRAVPWSEKLFKVLVIGNVDVGKTSIVQQYVRRQFPGGYRATVGVDFALKTLQLEPRTLVRLQLWDIAGQEQSQTMSRVYYRGAMGALVVFDLTNSQSLEAAARWKRDLDSKVRLQSGRPLPAVLLANKCDARRGGRDDGLPAALDRFCQEHSFSGWFETSAKDNINIDEAGTFLVRQMLRCDANPSGEQHQGGSFQVTAASAGQNQELCCWSRRV